MESSLLSIQLFHIYAAKQLSVIVASKYDRLKWSVIGLAYFLGYDYAAELAVYITAYIDRCVPAQKRAFLLLDP